MNRLKWFKRTVIAGGVILLLSVGGLTPHAGNAAVPDIGTTPFGEQAIAATGDPISVSKDEAGYTVWTYDYSEPSWCVMFSRLRYPFRLGAQDPTELSNATLQFNFSEQEYVVGAEGESRYTDPTWSVALNGKPGGWQDGAFTGEWKIIGAIATTPTRLDKVPVEQEIPLDSRKLIDGENNLWFQQGDFCNCSGLPDCACTCYELYTVKLRALVELGIRAVSPAPDAANVWPDQNSRDSLIRVRFTTLVSATTVNTQTFQVYYFNQDADKVYVPGTVEPRSEVEYVFVPAAPLLPGVKYIAQVWGEEDAAAHSYGEWVQDIAGGPLEQGKLWTFSTLPLLQVKLEPVQVLEGMALVHHKPTVLRAFVRWDKQPEVFWKSNAPDVVIDDVVIKWLPPGGSWEQARWSDGGNWQPDLSAQTARHRREYREFTFKEESYSLYEKRRLLDSFNYFGFTPAEMGVYQFEVTVTVTDSQGKQRPFRTSKTVNVMAENTFPLHMRAVAVGPDYGKTGTVDLSALIQSQIHGMRALYPVPGVNWPNAPSAMAWYSPTTTGWFVDWTQPPSWPYYSEQLYLLRDMDKLCLRTPGCWAMIGLTAQAWLDTPGTTQRESAPRGALVRIDPNVEAKLYIMAHEVGHLAHIDEHYEGPSGNGFDVVKRAVKNAEQEYVDFMTAMPVQEGDTYLWIKDSHYTLLWQWIMGHYGNRAQSVSTDPLLLVDGVITPTTGAVTLLPWYQLPSGDYTAPTPGPYRLVFLDAAQQELVGYTQSFTVSDVLRYAGQDITAGGGPAFFTFAAPYPAATAKVQIRRAADNAVLAEITPAATAPTLTINPAPAVWSGAQAVSWQSNGRYFAVDFSTDGGATWESLAVDLTAPHYTFQTPALPNTTQAYLRVAASDGLRTTTATAGPFTLDNLPLVGYISPPIGAIGVSVLTEIAVGFRDAMTPTTINTATFTLTGGPFGSVPGTVRYDAATRTATFTPKTPLAYGTTYTAGVTVGVRDTRGTPLPVAQVWTFTTEADTAPPTPVIFAPPEGAVNVPRNSVLAVGWDRALNAGTLNTTTFRLATAQGAVVSGAVTYNAATRSATFTPAVPLVTDTLYLATLKAGIQSADGHPTEGDFNWAFTTGSATRPGPAFTGGYADAGLDSNGDGVFEQVRIQVGVYVTATGNYALAGALADADSAPIAWAYITPTLTAGTHFLALDFDGAAIGGHGVDGPYTLTESTLTYFDAGRTLPLASVAQRDAYRTTAYRAARFAAPLSFGGLPDVVVKPGTTFVNAFNVRDYAQSVLRPAAQLSYTMMFNAPPAAGVALQSTGQVQIRPEEDWLGSAEVTIRASDGVNTVQASFTVLVGWPHTLHLPVVLRQSTGSSTTTRDGWVNVFTDGFEAESFSWQSLGWIAGWGDSYTWGRSACRVYAGQFSAWIAAAGTGAPLPCGATYPNTMGTMMYLNQPINLAYAGKGELRSQVWANLAAGDEVCLKVAVTDSESCENLGTTPYHGVCRSGQTNGWETLTLDLANVPTLGNVLGQPRVCPAIIFQADAAGNRSEGAYVDDVSLRLCPEGLIGACPGAGGVAPPSSPPPGAGSIGGYPQSITGATLAVEANGRIHALWSGKTESQF